MAQYVGGGGAGAGAGSSSTEILSVTCSICLDEVTPNIRRSVARLRCGHLFHLDCIGSEFNARGAMQCPNCREIENGEWLYANRGPEQSIHHGIENNILHHVIQMQPSGFHWHISHVLPFQVMGLPSPVYNETIEHHAVFSNVQNYNHHWSSSPVPSELVSQVIRTINQHYNNWNNHFVFTPILDHIIGANQASVQSATPRFAPFESDSIPSPESFAHHPVNLDHGSSAGTLGYFVSSTGLPYSGNNAPAHDSFRVPSQQWFGNSPSPVVRASMVSATGGSNRSRGLVPAQSAASSLDQTGDLYPVLSLSLPNQNLQSSERLLSDTESLF